jgi:hypothetical protein
MFLPRRKWSEQLDDSFYDQVPETNSSVSHPMPISFRQPTEQVKLKIFKIFNSLFQIAIPMPTITGKAKKVKKIIWKGNYFSLFPYKFLFKFSERQTILLALILLIAVFQYIFFLAVLKRK